MLSYKVEQRLEMVCLEQDRNTYGKHMLVLVNLDARISPD